MTGGPLEGDDVDAEVVEVFVHERADPVDILVLPRYPGDPPPPLVHYPCNQVGRWACGHGAGGPHTSLRTGSVTCGMCRRTRALRDAAELERVEAEVAARVEARHEALNAVRAYTWWCPLCDGSGDDGGGGRCYQCAGGGLTDDAGAAGWPDARPAPRPPGVRRTPCHDCAYRPGSQEDEHGDTLAGRERVFYCHQGTPLVRGEYQPLLWFRGLPVGSVICAGWWDVTMCGRRLDLAPAVYPDEGTPGVGTLPGD